MFCDRYFYDNTFVTQVIDIFLLKIVIQDLYSRGNLERCRICIIHISILVSKSMKIHICDLCKVLVVSNQWNVTLFFFFFLISPF